MAKKNKNQRVASEELVSNAPLKNADFSSSNAVAKDVKGGKGQKNKKDKKPSAGARIRKAFKEMFSELKKVNWPTAKKTASAFGIVIVIVLFFLVVISAFDYGIMQLIKLLMDASVGS